MAEIFSFQERREEKDASEPHVHGEVRCVHCHHAWYGVAPAVRDMPELLCPKCGLMKGFFMQVFQPQVERWVCNCGGDMFFIVADGTIQCCRCNKVTPN